MDARLDPAAAYGFNPGAVIVIRNAGASTRDAARSALLCSHLLGIEEIYVVKHTNCGMLGATTELAHEVMKKNLGASASRKVDEFDPLPIADLQTSAEEDVAYLRQHPLALQKVRVTGWIHDTDTGRIKKVVE
jgi:carbonic anhydrase